MSPADVGRLAFLSLLPLAYQKSLEERGKDHGMTRLYWYLMCKEAGLPLDTPQHPSHDDIRETLK